jgi:hypothetical protein
MRFRAKSVAYYGLCYVLGIVALYITLIAPNLAVCVDATHFVGRSSNGGVPMSPFSASARSRRGSNKHIRTNKHSNDAISDGSSKNSVSIPVPPEKVANYRKIVGRLFDQVFAPTQSDDTQPPQDSVSIPNDTEIVVSLAAANDDDDRREFRFVCRSTDTSDAARCEAGVFVQPSGVGNTIDVRSDHDMTVRRVYALQSSDNVDSEDGDTSDVLTARNDNLDLTVTLSSDTVANRCSVQHHPADSLVENSEQQTQSGFSMVAPDLSNDSMNIKIQVDLKNADIHDGTMAASIKSALLAFFQKRISSQSKLLLARVSAANSVREQSSSYQAKKQAQRLEKMISQTSDDLSSKHSGSNPRKFASSSGGDGASRYKPSSSCMARRTKRRGG